MYPKIELVSQWQNPFHTIFRPLILWYHSLDGLGLHGTMNTFAISLTGNTAPSQRICGFNYFILLLQCTVLVAVVVSATRVAQHHSSNLDWIVQWFDHSSIYWLRYPTCSNHLKLSNIIMHSFYCYGYQALWWSHSFLNRSPCLVWKNHSFWGPGKFKLLSKAFCRLSRLSPIGWSMWKRLSPEEVLEMEVILEWCRRRHHVNSLFICIFDPTEL